MLHGIFPQCGEAPRYDSVAGVTPINVSSCRQLGYAWLAVAALFVQCRGGVDDLVVRAPEALDRDSRKAFRRAALAAVETTLGDAPGGRLVVDLSGTKRVDSAGLGALIMVQQRAAELRRTVWLRGASEELRFLLVLTRLDDRFEFEPPAA